MSDVTEKYNENFNCDTFMTQLIYIIKLSNK